MSAPFLVSARRPTVLACDALAVAWIVVWIVVGVLVSREVHTLRTFGDTLDSASQALHQTADGLDSVSKVPVVGKRIGDVATSIDTTATQVASNANDTRHAVDRLSILLPVCLAAVAALPVAAVYLPLRLRRLRERRTLRAALHRDGREPVERYLAERAVVDLPYDQLRRITDDPWRDLESGRFRALASAELERLDIGQPGDDR